MIYRTLSRNDSEKFMQEWINTEKIPNLVDDDEIYMRNYLVEQYNLIKNNIGSDDKGKSRYNLDLQFGIVLYKYFQSAGDFTMRIASDDGFWRYLSLKIIPDLVSDRWGKDNEAHFWSRTTRIWTRQIWWYIKLSWQGSIEETESILSRPGFTDDEIMNLVERCGRQGAYLDVYPAIVKQYSEINEQERKKHREGDKSLFRKVMILNNARYVVIGPYLCGIDDYVKSLFIDLKVSMD